MQKMWDYLLSHYVPNVLYLITTLTKEELRHNNVMKSAIIIDDVNKIPDDISLILMAPKDGRFIQGHISITDFEHPTEAIYMFGPDNNNLDMSIFVSRKPNEYVYIPTETHHEMYAVTAATITLYDRMVKSNG